MSNAYEKSGVDIHKGYEAVERIKKHVNSTLRPEVMSGLGSFGALFKLDLSKYKEPILVSGTDGVGTKILLAQQSGKLDTVGIDCVAMCVNDILAQGAEPLFFLDYLAVGKNNPEKIEQIVSGVAKGCKFSNAALIGGETAEMPDLYKKDEFDLAGFCVGITDKAHMLDGSKVKEGDVLVGLKSSGIHSNGFSLVRKLFFKDNDYKFDTVLENGKTLIDELLTPTKIYVQDVAPLLDRGLINGISHITGGGFDENLPRMFGENLSAKVDLRNYEIPYIFKLMMELGDIDKKEMFNIFNMGIGMVLAVSKENADKVLKSIEGSQILGKIVAKKDANLEMIF
ncbi:MAG: phosphoribosylformylglycinamidine cyclo-ligase [Campylobacteraceae bacterium]|nr:phosphoribosylformylglycinamidine cyclo-ligase [Campylobacteraceae bacterium]